MGLGKVWPDLEILEVFLMGVEVSFLDNFFLFAKRFLGSRICHFFFPLALQGSHFSEFMCTAY